jgi:hypothetical protein
MCVTLQSLTVALDSSLASSPSCRIQLASRRAAPSQDMELRALGNFILLGDDQRVVLVNSGLCGEAFDDVPSLEPVAMLAKLKAHVDSHGGCDLEILHDVFVEPDGARALDYGGSCVEQMIWHAQREEIWLLVACATVFDATSGPLAPL